MELNQEKIKIENVTIEGNKESTIEYGDISNKNENGNSSNITLVEGIAKRINFSGKRVLEYGVRKSEIARYAIDNGAIHYEGVSFSKLAFRKVSQNTKEFSPIPIFHDEDALEFTKRYINNVNYNASTKFDIVVMFDFLEYVPRNQLFDIFTQLHYIIAPNALIAINTPAFQYDNNVVSDGLHSRNEEAFIGKSDSTLESTQTVINKYSVISLQKFMQEVGFLNLSEAHFFIRDKEIGGKRQYQSYRERWIECQEEGYPILGEYKDDEIEYKFVPKDIPLWSHFDNGIMKGINLLCTEYYKKSVYAYGEYDSEMFTDFSENHGKSKVVYDVGGFVGVSSLIFAKCMNQTGKVITFEPNPSNSNRILLNLSHNSKAGKCVTLIKSALGEKEHTQHMIMSENIDNGFSSTSRIESSHAKIADKLLPNDFYEEDVVIRTLDNVVKDIGLIPDVIKVDIEGAEHLFLLGAQETLKLYKPILYIELHSEFCAFKCTELLISFGYTLEVLHEEEDNRLIIKAYQTDKETANINLIGMSINSFTSSNNIQKNALNLLNKCNAILDNKIFLDAVFKETDTVSREREAADNEIVELKVLAEELHKIYDSRGWKMLQKYYKAKSKLFHK